MSYLTNIFWRDGKSKTDFVVKYFFPTEKELAPAETERQHTRTEHMTMARSQYQEAS
jgi:hypothetical protein